MAEYFCNPLNLDYRFQFHKTETEDGKKEIAREAADPSMIRYQGKYYIFASMTLEVWVSDDLVNWEQHRLPKELPLYDYAPDVRVIGDYVYLCASKHAGVCDFYRAKDVIHGPYERIEGTFAFWDPDMFLDDDGRLYFYWGCSNETPIWGVELDPETMKPISDKKVLICGRPDVFGYERCGDDNCLEDRSPFIEGAWMTKYKGKYYLQYACPGTEFNTYADGVYEADNPMGPFAPAKSNPVSLKPGGFLPGAGHGSTMEDFSGNFWHTSTMRISMNHIFERRVGIWPAGFDKDGVLFCDQRFGDWPMKVDAGQREAWQNPEWYLLSYKKSMTASSSACGNGAELAADENVQTWWKASTNQPGEWLEMDLGKVMELHAVQINFADDRLNLPIPGEINKDMRGRCIDERQHVTRWLLEGSVDGRTYFVLKDKSNAETNLPHDFLVLEEGRDVRYLKLTVYEVPLGQHACVSGLRAFGNGLGEVPEIPEYKAERIGGRDMVVTIEPQENVTGYIVLWGFAPDKLYHSWMTFEQVQKVSSLMDGEDVYIRVDAFNENGIAEGTNIIQL